MTTGAMPAGGTELGAYLDEAPCGWVSFTDDVTIAAVNLTLCRLLGYSRPELEGRSFETLMGVGARIFYQTHFFPLVRLHGHAQEIFLLLKAREGADVGVLCNAARRRHGDAWLTDCVFMHVQERRKF